MQCFVPQLTYFLNHPPLGFIRSLYLPSAVFYYIQDRLDTTLQNGVGIQPLVYALLNSTQMSSKNTMIKRCSFATGASVQQAFFERCQRSVSKTGFWDCFWTKIKTQSEHFCF
jgi:hypothetical protein